jgi:hypothetical protein
MGPDDDVTWDSFGVDLDLYGGTGDGKFVASWGDPNTYDGGDSSDRIDYRAMGSEVTCDLGAGTTSQTVQDTFTLIEETRGRSILM